MLLKMEGWFGLDGSAETGKCRNSLYSDEKGGFNKRALVLYSHFNKEKKLTNLPNISTSI